MRGRLLAMVAIGLLSTLPAQARERWDFRFSPAAQAPAEAVAVSSGDLYDPSKGFGFEPSYRPEADKPFLFSVKVPEGNYRVTVTLGDARAAGDTTVKAESRRLMLADVATAKGRFETHSFIVNVRDTGLPPPPPNAPGGAAVRINEREVGKLDWDDKLTLEFDGKAPKLAALSIERAEVPTLYLAGDSTVTDQPAEPGASWGQMLTAFLTPDLAVANHAESGETLKSFITGLRLDKLLSRMKPGDYLFIQFGHNDSKQGWPQTYADPATTYPAYLRVFIAEARRRGATPVLVTPMHRRSFDAKGQITNSHGDYPDAVRRVAAEEKVALIDLTAMSKVLYEALGPEIAPRAFAADGKDATHHNNYGAWLLARCVVEGIRASALPLKDHIRADVSRFDPAHPPLPDAVRIAESPMRSDVTPRGN
ncbi:rhamnogalacturonan acetylesterase [Niveispirillum sp. SYP-B3756]|uniref:rhamnogalacturonan acetylesterase n=1 Tax=Niveispirillum sp. SYP-B3756 TaxID=2662178 RepID=UPI001B3B6986|nr:rhamnogalacturonan acetylesterase [Niveispirillum sp. SYP-B3756]